MAEVTNTDRERAHEVLGYYPRMARNYGTYEYARIQQVAAALAEEREKARAPFLALADEWVRDESDGDPADVLIWATFKACANDVRRAAEETP